MPVVNDAAAEVVVEDIRNRFHEEVVAVVTDALQPPTPRSNGPHLGRSRDLPVVRNRSLSSAPNLGLLPSAPASRDHRFKGRPYRNPRDGLIRGTPQSLTADRIQDPTFRVPTNGHRSNGLEITNRPHYREW